MNTESSMFTNIDFLESESVISLNDTGTRLAKSGEMQEAEKYFLKAIDLDPDYPQSYHNLAILQGSQHKTKDAIENMEKVIALQPENPEHFTNIGIIYFLEGSYYESEINFRKAITIDSEYPDALFNLGKLLLNLERADEALPLIEQFHKTENSNTEAMDILGICYLKLGEREKAVTIWEKALATDPGLNEVRSKLQEIEDSVV